MDGLGEGQIFCRDGVMCSESGCDNVHRHEEVVSDDGVVKELVEEACQRDAEKVAPEHSLWDEQEDEGCDAECVELEEEEEISRGESGLGFLWKLSLCATLMFFAWAFMGGVAIECRNPIPEIRERDPVQTIVRRQRKQRRRATSPHEATGSTSQ